MVRDLVVVDEVHVDAVRAAQHLPPDQRHVQVAHHAVAHRPEERERPRPVHAGDHVARLLLAGLEALPEGLVRRTPEAAGQAVRPQHEPRHGLPGLLGPAAEPDPTHREHAGRRIAGEQVGDRHPVVGEQAEPVAGAALDDRRVGRPVGDEHPAELAVVPTERRYAGTRAVQDALLAGRRGARQLHGPLLEPVPAGVHPPPEVRHRAGLQRPPGHRERHPVELDEDDAVDLGVRDARLALAEPAQRHHEGVVGAGGRQPGQEGADRGGDPGRCDQGPEGRHLDPGDDAAEPGASRSPARRWRARRPPASRWRWRP